MLRHKIRLVNGQSLSCCRKLVVLILLFFFDEDGKAYIVNNDEAPDNKPEYSGHRTIRIQEFDVKTDKTIGPRKILVNKGGSTGRQTNLDRKYSFI